VARLIFISETDRHADPRFDYEVMFPGDCVEVFKSGTFPGTKVVNNPRFRIVDDDSVGVAPYLFLLEREPYEPGVGRHQRRWNVDLPRLVKITAQRFGRRIDRVEIIQATLPIITSLASVKRLVGNRRMIG
jgi:hypothetical protein